MGEKCMEDVRMRGWACKEPRTILSFRRTLNTTGHVRHHRVREFAVRTQGRADACLVGPNDDDSLVAGWDVIINCGAG